MTNAPARTSPLTLPSRLLSAPTSLHAHSPLLWGATQATIVSPSSGRTAFQPYPFQARLLTDRSPRRLVLKARQVGVSNTIAIEAVHEATQRPDRTILLVSHGQRYARQLVAYAQHTLTGMRQPPALRVETQSELGFANGSRIVSLSATP